MSSISKSHSHGFHNLSSTKMTQINCADCLKTYRPYSYFVALRRVLMYGFSDWQEFEEEADIMKHFREQWRDNSRRSQILQKKETYRRDQFFVEDFNFYYQYLESKRRKSISASFLCFDCEKYYCVNCVRKHSGHFTFSKDDKYSISKSQRISAEMLDKLKAEGDQKVQNMKHEHIFLFDVVDINYELDQITLDSALERMVYFDDAHSESFLQEISLVKDIHICSDNKKWLVTGDRNKCIKIFNVNDNKMTRCIRLSSSPYGITEITSTDPSKSLIAVSFPYARQINILNIQCEPTQVISSITVQGTGYDLAYCDNILITLCRDYQDGVWRNAIYVIDMSGEIIKIIDLGKLPDIQLNAAAFQQEPHNCSLKQAAVTRFLLKSGDVFYTTSMSVHSESDTIYVCNRGTPSSIISLSLDGQVLHSVTFKDLKPELICVDMDQNVFVMGHRLPIYKLSADLSKQEKIFEDTKEKIPATAAMSFHDNKFYLASFEGRVYILQYD